MRTKLRASCYRRTGMDSDGWNFLLGLLREAYEGGREGDATYFVDNRSGAGLLDTLRLLSAEEASAVVLPGTSSIAGHVVHLIVSLEATRDELDGGAPQVDWPATWARQAVDVEEWNALRRDLEARYREVLDRCEAQPGERTALEALTTTTAHGAWHLGAIRQLMGTRVERQG